MRTTRCVFMMGAVVAGAALLAEVARATPGSGVNLDLTAVVARAPFASPVDLMIRLQGGDQPGREVLQVRNAGDTVMQRIVFEPGGQTGWHSHPGPAIVLVTEGELTLYSSEDPACAGRTYGAGEAFIDSGQGHVHLGQASLTEPTELWVTYFDVPAGLPFRIDAANPGNCPF